ncbi:hypothetical protein [Rhodococcus sp. T9N]|uniref:hypothetical protein n=2 Tax=Rhodococcus sp. T9N TaxID=627445 RepID=UPI0021C2D98B|nr:hypothetical protein [Rhodococcus sp. T9N]
MKKILAASILAGALLVSACNSSSGGAPVATGESVTSGPLQSSFGTPVDVMAAGGEKLGTVTFLEIENDPKCTKRYGPITDPKGMFVAVKMQVSTTPSHDEYKFMRTTGRDFSEITPAGITKSADSNEYNCLEDRDDFGSPFQASSTYEGWVLLDVSDPGSKLSYLPQYAPLGTSAILLPPR